MTLKDELALELDKTLRDFHHLLDSIPEASYHHPSGNPAWTIGEVLHHITLGPVAVRFEVWMIRHARGLFRLFMNDTMASLFNRTNAMFMRRPKRITRQGLLKAYEAGHEGLMSSLRRADESDFARSVTYLESLAPELAGVVSIERLFRYVKIHLDAHTEEIRKVEANLK